MVTNKVMTEGLERTVVEAVDNLKSDEKFDSVLKGKIERICADFRESRLGNRLALIISRLDDGLNLFLEAEEALKESRECLEEGVQARLWSAICWRDYQLSMTERAFEAEQEQIETEFAQEKAQLKETILQDLLARRQSLLEERERLLQQRQDQGNGIEDDSIIPSAGLLESAGVLPGGANGTANGGSRHSSRRTGKGGKTGETAIIPNTASGAPLTTSKRRGGASQSATNVLGMSTMLPDNEIYEDLNAISRALGQDDLGMAGRRNAARHPKGSSASSRKRAIPSGNVDSAAASPQMKAPKTELVPAADDEDVFVEAGILHYHGSAYPKGSSFILSYESENEPFQVILVSATQSEVQGKKATDGSKVRVPLVDLVEGAVSIIPQE